MNENDIKIYTLPHWSIVLLTIIYAFCIVACGIICVVFFSGFWWFIFLIVLMSIIGIIIIKKGYFKPMSINSQRVKREQYEYLWEEIRITVCQAGTNGFRILIGTEYATDKEIIQATYKRHFYTFLKKESLDVILRFAKHKIKIVTGGGEEIPSMGWQHRKLKKIIDDFNAAIN
ncbi:MAG: hypothetical protein NC099_02465 [Corallococcus sp.]|nr:hypothetical protein [Corallococcus sp.]